ncbi:MAG: TetR/AcrR family transcriptional regulator, partial [Deltaproteobacteria bacterium]
MVIFREMGTEERRERERLARRELILASAKELFLKKGFGATTMD